MHWRTVVRMDPNKGAVIRGYQGLEDTVRRGAREYYGDSFGKNSFSGNEPNRLFLSSRGQRFTDLTGISGAGHTGDGRTFALLDFDRDGWCDIASVNSNAPKLVLFRNEIGGLIDKATPRGTIALRFLGGNTSPSPSARFSNRDGYGARVSVELEGLTLTREHTCGQGVFTQNSTTMLIGIGEAQSVKSVTVRWPSGVQQTVESVSPGTLLTVRENAEAGSAFSRTPYHNP